MNTTSTDTKNQPGHRDAGPDYWHFPNHGCIECDAYTVSRLNLGNLEDWYRTGRIGQVMYEAYMHVWTTETHHYGNYGDWTPTDPEVREASELIRRALNEWRETGSHGPLTANQGLPVGGAA